MAAIPYRSSDESCSFLKMRAIQPVVRVGLLIPREAAYGRAILRGIIKHARQQPLWELIDGGPPSIAAMETLLQSPGVDGVIAEVRDADLLEHCRRRVAKLVLVASGQRALLRSRWGRVSAANVAVGRMAFEFFYNKGFRNLAFLGIPGRPFSDLRLQGLQEAAAACRLEVALPPRQPGGELPAAELTRWLSNLPPQTAILTANDEFGLRVLRDIRTIGRVAPEDLVVLGVDNDDLICELTHPALSSIDINTEEMGLQAARLFERLLQGPLLEANRSVQVRPRAVVERRSTDFVAVEDARLRRALGIIHERACEGLTISELLPEVYMSRRALEVAFKNSFGLTLQQQIDRVRVARARTLLVETTDATPDVAAACGWPSASQMCKTFRRHTRMTPTEYRRRAAALLA